MAELLENDKTKLRAFCAKYPLRFFKKDRPLFYQGEIPQSGFFIKSGFVKFYNITSGGEEKILGYESSDGLIPVEWIFHSSPVSMYYYDSFTDVQAYSVPRNELIEFLNSTQQAATTLLSLYISAFISKTIHLHALEQSRARDKLLYLMQYLALRFGKPLGSSRSMIQLRLTHQDIANLVGVTRETASTELGKLTKEGIIKSKDLHYVVDKDKALRVLGENEFGEITLS